MLRSHAMTIGQLARRTGVPIKVLRKDESLTQAVARVEAQIATLQALRQRILEFQAAATSAPAPPAASALVQLLAQDPRR
jgi:hypothetical protein